MDCEEVEVTLNEWVHIRSMTWGEFGALVDCNPNWAYRVVQGTPCSKELGARIHTLTGIWPNIGRGSNWRRKHDDGRMRLLISLIEKSTPTADIMKIMGYKNLNSTRAMMCKARKRMRNGCAAKTNKY